MHTRTADKAQGRGKRLEAFVATDEQTVRSAQQLRYRVFVEELGAKVHHRENGLDYDEVDDYCDHLVVVEPSGGRIVGYSRLLNDVQALRLGRFYSDNEFELKGVLSLPGRFLEIGRTCVDPDFRGSAVIATLWSRLAEYVAAHGYDYLMGCASIPPGPNGFAVEAVYRQIPAAQSGPAALKVHPKTPVPAQLRCTRDESGIPPLLKAYLKLGAWICGEPCWDKEFHVMDVFVLLPIARLVGRYEKHFFADRERPHGSSVATGL